MADTTTMQCEFGCRCARLPLARDDFGHGVGGSLWSSLCKVRVRGEGSGRTKPRGTLGGGESIMSAECERLLMMLSPSAMERLRKKFEKHPGGVSVSMFVMFMGQVLPKKYNIDDIVVDIQELFAQIDVDGSGHVDWSEFSGFCIEVGMAASNFGNTKRLPNTFFQQRNAFEDPTLYNDGVRKVRYFPEQDKLFVLDRGEPKISVYKVKPPPNTTSEKTKPTRLEYEKDVANLKTTKHIGGEMYLLHTLVSKPPSKDHATENEAGVNDVCLLDNIDVLALATSGLSLAFWGTRCYKELPPRMQPRFLKSIYTRTPQTVLAWHKTSKTLFSTGGSDMLVTRWKINVLPKFACASISRYHGHVGIITDMLTVPELYWCVTSSMDGQIFLWSTKTNKWKEARPPLPPGRTPYVKDKKGLSRKVRSRISAHGDVGVRCIAYAGDGMLLSTAFDFQIIGWNIDGVTNRPLFKLTGTRAPLLGVDCVPSTGTAVTVDVNGNCRRWDISVSEEGSIRDQQRCLQIWSLKASTDDDIMVDVNMNPTSMVMTKPAGSLIIAGKRLHIFDQHIRKAADAPVTCLVYNSVTMTFLGTVKRNVRIWNAQTGKLDREYLNVMPFDITSVCLDGRQRKFFLGDARGNVKVFNYLNGVLMDGMVFRKHKRQISQLSYVHLQDRTFVSASWDGTIRVLLDEPPEEGESALSDQRTLLREISSAHKCDITAVNLSRELSLIASGDSQGKIKVWDLEFCFLDGLCLGHSTEITSLLFLEPKPLLISGDADGTMCVWSVRPHHPSSICLFRFGLPKFSTIVEGDDVGGDDTVLGQSVTKIILLPTSFCPDIKIKRRKEKNVNGKTVEDETKANDDESKVSLSTDSNESKDDNDVPQDNDDVPQENDDGDGEKHEEEYEYIFEKPRVSECICVADDSGHLSCFDLRSIVIENKVVEPPPHKKPTTKNSFNPRRRCEKETDEEVEMKNKLNEVFRYFDEDDSGEIDRYELKQAMEAMGHTMTQEETDTLLASIDFDGNGTVDQDEFEHLVMQTLIAKAKEAKEALMRTGKRLESDSTVSSLSKAESATNLPAVPLKPYLRWKAHNGSIYTVEPVHDPSCIVTTGEDLKVQVWDSTGHKVGVLTRGKLKDDTIAKMKLSEKWKFQIDIKTRDDEAEAKGKAILKNIEKIKLRQLEEKKKSEEHKKFQKHLKQIKQQAQSPSSKSDRSLSFVDDKNIENHKRLVGQVIGGMTWNLNAAEQGYVQMLAKEKAQIEDEKRKRKKERLEDFSDPGQRALVDMLSDDHIIPRVSQYLEATEALRKEGRSVKEQLECIPLTDGNLTHTVDYQEMQDKLLQRKKIRHETKLPEISSIRPLQLPADDQNNWGINSKNRQRRLYPLFYEERDRAEAAERLKEEQNTFDPVAAAKPSSFLIKQFQLAEERRKREQKRLKKLLLGRDANRGILTEESQSSQALAEVTEEKSIVGKDENISLNDEAGGDDAMEANDVKDVKERIGDTESSEIYSSNAPERQLFVRKTKPPTLTFSAKPNVTTSSTKLSRTSGTKVPEDDKKPGENTGLPDTYLQPVLLDTTGDGEADIVGYDTTGDGYVDRVDSRMVYDINGDGNIDKGDSNFGKTLDNPKKRARQQKKKKRRIKRHSLKNKKKTTKTYDVKKDVKRFLRKKRHAYSMPDITGLEEKNRRERLVDGPSMAELVSKRIQKHVDNVYKNDSYDKTAHSTLRVLNRKKSSQKLARLKHDLFGEPIEGFESSEGSDASDYEEVVAEEKPKIEFTDELIERLRAKKNFGIYQIDMVKTFRKIIREVDADHSGEIDQLEFLMAIQKLHEEDVKIPSISDSGDQRGETFAALVEKAEENSATLQRMVESMFASIDSDGSGAITVDEMVGVLFPRAPKDELKDIHMYLMMPDTPRFDEDKDGDESDEEKPLAPEHLEELRLLFDLYDEDGSGTLDLEELRNAVSGSFLFEGKDNISSEASAVTSTDFQRYVAAADTDGDGIIDFEEWILMMRHIYDKPEDDSSQFMY